ncbi:uncharacterized protein LOC119179859 isoform X2 [Rhipicephalus microplus]|uniref:uncharacterized protein LOC119179859 isoform X2 n=1 Tax=Rhipicephalus microplus TaxID=6941 RepID=UPI003F6B9961
MKRASAFASIYLYLALVHLYILNGDAEASCIGCLCYQGQSSCQLGNGPCECRNDYMYFVNGSECVSDLEDCGLHVDKTRFKRGCTSCHCSLDSDVCSVDEDGCVCRDGNLYKRNGQCAESVDECKPLTYFREDSGPNRPSGDFASGGCAKCRCPDGENGCHLLGNKCDCLNGKYYMPDSDQCVQNEDDCILGSPSSGCAKCQCPDGGNHCHLLGNKCHCIDGKYYMPGSNQCVQDKDDCILKSPDSDFPTEGCAKCRCPGGGNNCHLLGNKCNCIDGKYYMPGSDQCVQDKDDCIVKSPDSDFPSEGCAKCRCPGGGNNCHLLGNKCNCIDGKYYMPGSNQCVQDKDDCIVKSPDSDFPSEGCAKCRCPGGGNNCHLLGNKCNCIDGKYYMPGSNQCVQDKDDCIVKSPDSDFPSEGCAKCRCPDGGNNCHLFGNKCNCIDGKYYMPGSNQCVQDKDDCILGSPLSGVAKSGCAKCQCPNGESNCHLLGSKCECRNGNYYMPRSEICVQDSEHCILVGPSSGVAKGGCAKCQCPNGKSNCHLLGSKCECRNGNYYMPGSEICVQDSKICILGSTVSGGCAKCRCPDGGKKCHLLGNKCDCDNGRYYIPGSNRCVLSEKECILDAPASTHCAKCRCPGGGDNCLLIGNKCDCFLGKYYLPGSPRCVENAKDCELVNPLSECAKCRCPNEEDHCHLLGNKCECIQGKYYMPDSDQCVRNTDDCILANPVGTRCAQCKCPAGVSSCLLIGNKCNCYNGKYYKSGSDQCVENVEDCVFVNPVRDNCAPCRCPDGGRNCRLYGNKCKCINGQYFMPGSDKCVQDADDCELVNPMSSCIPCECGDDKTSCSVAGSSCRCVNGMMYEPDRDVCAEDLTKCEFYTKSSCTPCECGDDRTSCSVAGSSCRCVNGMMYEPDRDVCAEDLAKCEFYTKRGRSSKYGSQPVVVVVSRPLSPFRRADIIRRCKTCECGNGSHTCSISGSSCRCVNGEVYEPHRDECAQDLARCEFHGRSRGAPTSFRNPVVIVG